MAKMVSRFTAVGFFLRGSIQSSGIVILSLMFQPQPIATQPIQDSGNVVGHQPAASQDHRQRCLAAVRRGYIRRFSA